jgi:hypothetical protein
LPARATAAAFARGRRCGDASHRRGGFGRFASPTAAERAHATGEHSAAYNAIVVDAPQSDDRHVARRYHHHVYVVELDIAVLREARFRRANAGYAMTRPCVYVGMTGLTPDVRFDKHKAGLQANRYVQQYGLRLLPALYEPYNPMPYQGAVEMEVELAIALREAGYAVWQG